MQATPRQDCTTSNRFLHLAFELGGSHWKLGFAAAPGRVRERNVAARDLGALWKEIAAAKARFGLSAETPVTSCYEAGRDGFWLHRALTGRGVDNVVVEPASILVDRRARRTKTDRLDVKRLLGLLIRHAAGERDHWRIVRVPAPEIEDFRQLPRERERLVKERTQHVNRIRALLAKHGIKSCTPPTTRGFEAVLEDLRLHDGSRLPPRLLNDLMRQLARLRLVQEQIKEIEEEQKALLAREAPSSRVVESAQRLACLKGIGPVSAIVLSAEFFGWRDFKNRRQVGALAGLTDSPWKSDGIDRQQGISKAGNPRVRALAIELAWGWLRWQPESALTEWFRDNSGTGKKRFRRVAIVALARKLLVALWHYLDHGLIPDGAVLKA